MPMTPRQVAISSGLAGLALGCGIGWTLTPRSAPAVPVGVDGSDGAAPALARELAPESPTAASMAEAGSQLESLLEGQRRLETAIARLGDRPLRSTVTPAGDSVPVAGMNVDLLARAMQEAQVRREREELAVFTPRELHARIENAHERGDFGAARRAFDELLRRDLEPEERIEAMHDFGEHLRETGQPGESAELLEQALLLSPPGTEMHVATTFELVWTRMEQDMPAEALRLAESVASAPAAGPERRAEARFAMALAAWGVGEHDRARGDLEALIAEYEGEDEFRWLVRESREHLEEWR